jgi:hypothetical protein
VSERNWAKLDWVAELRVRQPVFSPRSNCKNKKEKKTFIFSSR